MDIQRISLKRKLAMQLTLTCAAFALLFVMESFARLYLNCSGGVWWGRVPVSQQICAAFAQNYWEDEILSFVSTIALTQVLKVALVGAFCAFIFNRSVTRHMYAVASYLKKAAAQDSPGTLKLRGFNTATTAELHDIESSLNAIVEKMRGIAKESRGEASIRLNAELAVELERMSATCESVTSILHDVNNGLSALLHNPARIERLMALDDGVNINTKENIGKVLENQERIVTMMSKLISTQHTRASKGRLTAVSLKDVVRDAIEIEGMRFVRAGISLEHDRLSDFSMHGCKDIYMSILMNLLKNAREAILSSNCQERVVRLSSWKDNDKVIFEVRDSGCGVEREQLAMIGTYGFTTKSTGQGFGLAGARRMLVDMDGWLTVESAGPGKGTSVKIGLPAV